MMHGADLIKFCAGTDGTEQKGQILLNFRTRVILAELLTWGQFYQFSHNHLCKNHDQRNITYTWNAVPLEGEKGESFTEATYKGMLSNKGLIKKTANSKEHRFTLRCTIHWSCLINLVVNQKGCNLKS